MKLDLAYFEFVHYRVAPRTGAWIETSRFEDICRVAGVAPRTGAWIETAT